MKKNALIGKCFVCGKSAKKVSNSTVIYLCLKHKKLINTYTDSGINEWAENVNAQYFLKYQEKHNKAGACPICGNVGINYLEDTYNDGKSLEYPWECPKCGATGVEVYDIKFITNNVY